eukprot:g26297.t1
MFRPSGYGLLRWNMRAQMLYKTVSKSTLGLTDVEEATSGTADTTDQVGRCAGEPLFDMKEVEHPILGADVAEAEELGVGDRLLAGRWVRGGVVRVAVEVNELEIDVGFEAVTRDGDREVQEGERGIRDGPVANHFKSTSHSLGAMSILVLLQCHNDATCKLEEQHLIFRLGSLQPDGLN